jgi:hypothetical protein
MKRAILVTLVVVSVSSPAFAQTGYIGLFSDPTYVDCEFNDIMPALVPVYVVHKSCPGATGSQWKVQEGGGFTCTFVGEIHVFPQTIGSTYTGITIDYEACLSSDILLATINYFCNGLSPTCSYLEVVPDPASGTGMIEVLDCANPPNVLPGNGSRLYVNNDGSCPGCGEINSPCDVWPVSLNYDSVMVGDHKDMSFTIANDGFGMLSGTVSESCSDFDILSGGGEYTMFPGETLVVSVRFEPPSVGPHTCTVETGSGLCYDVYCTGYAWAPPACQVDPAVLDFGTVKTGSSKDSSFTITNVGGGELMGTVEATCHHYTIVSGDGYYYLEGGQSRIVVVRYTPRWNGPHTCLIETGASCGGDVECTGVGDFGTGIGDERGPVAFALYQNYPNPFNPHTTISYSVDREEDVVLAIYDITGKHVRTLVNRPMTPGVYEEEWDGKGANGLNVTSGIYFYRLKAGQRVLTRKMVLTK